MLQLSLSRILLIVIALILYGSLYPWEWRLEPIQHPLQHLLRDFHRTPDRFLLRDVFINILLYLPLGVSAFLALKHFKSSTTRLAAAVIFGLILSTLVEVLQLGSRGRYPSLVDVVANGLGSLLGALLAVMFRSRLAAIVNRSRRRAGQDIAAFGLLTCWYAMLLTPFFPVLGRTHLLLRIEQYFASGSFHFVPFVSALVSVACAGYLLQACGMKRVQPYLVASTFLFPCQLFIVSRQPELSEWLGAGLGCIAFLRLPHRPRLIGWSFFGVVVLRGLAPFTFREGMMTMSWIPFGGFLGMAWQAGVEVLLEKCFYYGAALWTLRYAGMRLSIATATVAGALAIIEVAQMHLPRRTPEITDPILAILLGIVLDSLAKTEYPGREGAGPVV
ncbi:MAG: VanZ family protein [Bryobacteraceae bacterium]